MIDKRLTDTLKPVQTSMVAPNALFVAQVHVEPKAWFRAFYAGEVPVGFVRDGSMLGEETGSTPALRKENGGS